MIVKENPQPAIRQAQSSLINHAQGKEGDRQNLGKQDFLNLLMTQLTHQDPLNPMDSQGMMQQLSQMGSLEQLINLNKGLSELNETQSEISRANAYSFLDKDVTVRGGNATVTAGSLPDLRFRIDREAANVKVFISDKDGRPVRSLDLGQQGPGRHLFIWDARNGEGQPVPDGHYRYKVIAKTQEQESLPVELFMSGKVSSLEFENGHPFVKMNGERIRLSDILELSNASQKLFAERQPRALQEELKPKPPAVPVNR